MIYLRERFTHAPSAQNANPPAMNHRGLPVEMDSAAGIAIKAMLIASAAAYTAADSRFIAMPKSLHP